jgi:oligoribonuclease NrnB/cAMP/cGMP phosphodiesterase (DHH superfamily)
MRRWKYLEVEVRLVTRSDFDGLVCAVLLKQVEQIDSIQFVHPKDLQDGSFEVTKDDVLTNVPYVPGCGLWFDHHASELDRVVGHIEYNGSCRLAPSAARVVYDYYGGALTFGRIDAMMAEFSSRRAGRLCRLLWMPEPALAGSRTIASAITN